MASRCDVRIRIVYSSLVVIVFYILSYLYQTASINAMFILTSGTTCLLSWLSADCLNVTCVQGESGKSISTIDSALATEAHDADTDSDLARPPDGKRPSARHATPAMLLRSATGRRTAGHVVAHSGPSDSE